MRLKRLAIVLSIGVIVLLFGARPALAQEDCESVCVDADQCNQSVHCFDGHMYRDCFHYNHERNLCPVCEPNFEYSVHRVLGYFAVDDYFYNYCFLAEAAIIVRHETNCNDSPDYYFCTEWDMGLQRYPAGQCCSYYFCGGQTCEEWDGNPG